MSTIAQIIVALFSVVIVSVSSWGIFFPDRLTATVRSAIDKSWGMTFAVVVRILFGASLLLAAPTSKFVDLFMALGGLILIAAVAIPFIGRKRLIPILDWFRNLPSFFIRLWLLLGVLFGVFMLYGISGIFD